MATTYNHAQIGIVDASGNVNVIYPITTGADVSITRTNTKLPTTATTAQKLADSLGKLAFLDSQINDSATSTTSTWSSNLINTKLTELNSNLTKSFQAGVDSIYNKCVSCGSTPTAKTPSAIVTAIANIYTNRYNTGYNAGKANATVTLSTLSISTNSYSSFTITTSGKSNILIFDYATQWNFSSANNGSVVFSQKHECTASNGTTAGNVYFVYIKNVTSSSLVITRSGYGTGTLRTPIVYGF